MAALLLLGGLLGGIPQIWGVPGENLGGSETPPELEEEVSIVRRWDPQPPHCFTRTLHELRCFWDSPGEPDTRRYRLQFRLEQDPWQECPLSVTALSPGGGARFWCSLPPSATVTFVPLELRVLPGARDVTDDVTDDVTPPPLFQRTIYIDQLVLPGPPQNVSVSAGGARGELCVRWAPPPGPYLHSSLVFELALSPPGGPPKTVGVPAGRREQGVGGLRGSTPYSVRARARPDGLSYGGFWSPWSTASSATTAPEVDAVTLGLSCLLVLLLLGLGVLGVLGHRRTLQAKLWPPVPGPEREFEGLFSNCGGNFQLWLCQGPGSPWAPPAPPPLESEDAVEEVGAGHGPEAPPPQAPPPPGPGSPAQPPSGPSPSPSFEYTLFEPGSALLCPPPRGHAPYANLGPPPKPAPPTWGGHAPHYVICS